MTESGSLALRVERAARRALFKICRHAVHSMSYRQVQAIGALTGEVQFRVSQVFQRRLSRQIAFALGGAGGGGAIADILRSAFRVNNAGVLEILKILEAPQDLQMLMSQVEVTGIPHVRAALAEGNGAILLGTHMGNSALLMIQLAECGIPLSVVYRDAPMMEPGFFGRGIARYGIEAILSNRGARAYLSILSALRNNRAVYMCIDQGVKNPDQGVMLRFLGKDMPVSAGPALLVRQSNARVLPVAAVAAEPKWKFEILPPLQDCSSENRAEDLRAMLKTSEQIVLRSPHLWSWHHRRWRHLPLAAIVNPRE